MNIHFKYTIFIVVAAVCTSCKNLAKYAIDERPMIKADTHLLGIWKAIEDTDKANYIFIQDVHDISNNTKSNNRYYLSYMTGHGLGPLYTQWEAYMSNLNGVEFLNIFYDHTSYHDLPGPVTGFKPEKNWVQGYFLLRLNINKTYDTITTVMINDTTLMRFKDSNAERDYLSKNMEKPSFYKDTLHLYKVSSYHQSLKESVKKAN